MRTVLRWMCLVLLVSVASPARRAHAADLQIDWSAPPECSSAAELRARVLDLMGGAVPSNLLAVVEVTRAAHNYRANVLLRSRTGVGERRVEHARCDVLADTVAVLIVLSIPNQTPPATQRGFALALSPQARLLLGSLPSLAAGLGGSIAIEGLGGFRLELQAAYYFPQTSHFEQTALGGRFQLLTFGACVCRLWSSNRVQGGPCLGAQVHRIRAQGFGGGLELPGSTSWWGPSLRLLGQLQLWAALAIQVSVEGMLPVFRPQFVFSDVGELHRVSAFAWQASLGPEVRF